MKLVLIADAAVIAQDTHNFKEKTNIFRTTGNTALLTTLTHRVYWMKEMILQIARFASSKTLQIKKSVSIGKKFRFITNRCSDEVHYNMTCCVSRKEGSMSAIRIIFAPKESDDIELMFVEVENTLGESIGVGTWSDDSRGYKVLEINSSEF